MKLLTKKRKIMRNPSLKAWEREFRELITHAGEGEVRETLQWYADHFGEKYVPRAYSARAFRDKYVQLRDRMTETTPVKFVTPDELTSIESKIYRRIIREMSWPDVRPIPGLLRASISNYLDVVERIRDLRFPDGVKFGHLERLRTQLLTNSELRPFAGDSAVGTFMVSWFRRLWDGVRKWSKWNGSLPPDRFVFSVEHPEFLKIGASESMKRFGSHGPWNQFLKHLNES